MGTQLETKPTPPVHRTPAQERRRRVIRGIPTKILLAKNPLLHTLYHYPLGLIFETEERLRENEGKRTELWVQGPGEDDALLEESNRTVNVGEGPAKSSGTCRKLAQQTRTACYMTLRAG